MKRGKKYKKIVEKVDRAKAYTVEEAVKVVKKISTSSFVGSLEMHLSIKLPANVQANSVKGLVTLPVMDSKEVKVAVFVPPEQKEEAVKAGADKVGLEDLMKDVEKGKVKVDVYMAVPEVMGKIAVLGKVLGPKGLMPNPKTNTVVPVKGLASTIKDFKKGKVKVKADDGGSIHLSIGKLSFKDADLVANAKYIYKYVGELLNKPSEQVVQRVYLAPSMGPSIKVDIKSLV